MNQHDENGSEHPPLRLTDRTGGDPPDPADGPFAIERMEVLSHELGNLLDGSMRCLSLARRLLTRGGEDEPTERIARQLDTVYTAMERMADLVNAAMRGSASVVGSPTLSPEHPITLGEAIRHAMDVLGPLAAEHRVTLEENLDPAAAALHAGPMYSVVLNGLRNGVESVARTGSTGRVEVRAFVRGSAEGGSQLAVIEILDDGGGVPSRQAAARAFRAGVSSKPGGLGVGLALSREIVAELGGAIDLCPREDVARGERPGAVLRIVFPPPRDKWQQRVG